MQKKNKVQVSEGKISPVIIIAVIVVVVAAAGGFLFLSKKGSMTGALTNEVGSMMNANCPFKDGNVCRFMGSWEGMKDYSVESVMTDSAGKKTDNLMEMSGGDKFHVVTKENGKEIANMITIGDTTYTKDYSDNSWFMIKQPKETQTIKNEMQTNLFGNITPEPSQPAEPQVTFKAMGKEACGNMQCFKYQVISPSDNGTTVYVWFDDSQYKLRRTVTQEKDGSTSDSAFSYNAIAISVPSPVKEMPGVGAMTGGESGAGNGQIPNLNPTQEAEMQKKIQDLQNTYNQTQP
ncbi:MAG: hypothetical protein M1366_02815 [Patescibacteria group bacterium]|nr:hypothetical protein [Patescibacteria group bacterium]